MLICQHLAASLFFFSDSNTLTDAAFPRSRCALEIVLAQSISSAHLFIVRLKLQGNFERTWVWTGADLSALEFDHNQMRAHLSLIINGSSAPESDHKRFERNRVWSWTVRAHLSLIINGSSAPESDHKRFERTRVWPWTVRAHLSLIINGSSATGPNHKKCKRKIVDDPALEAFRSENISIATESDQKPFRTQVSLIREGFERKISDKIVKKCRKYLKPSLENHLLRCFHYVLGVFPSSFSQPGWGPFAVEFGHNQLRAHLSLTINGSSAPESDHKRFERTRVWSWTVRAHLSLIINGSSAPESDHKRFERTRVWSWTVRAHLSLIFNGSSATGPNHKKCKRKIVVDHALEAFRSESISRATESDQKPFRTQVSLIRGGFESKRSDKIVKKCRKYLKPSLENHLLRCFPYVLGVFPPPSLNRAGDRLQRSLIITNCERFWVWS